MSWDLRRSWGWRRCSCTTWSKYNRRLRHAAVHGRSPRPSHLQAGRSRPHRGLPDTRSRQEARRCTQCEEVAQTVWRRARTADRGAHFVLREGTARAGWTELRRAGAIAVVGGEPRGAWLQPLLRRADRRVGGRGGRGREVIPARDIGARCALVGRAGRGAGAVLRMLAVTAARRVPSGLVAVERRGDVSRRRAQDRAPRRRVAWREQQSAAGDRAHSSEADSDASRKGATVRSRVERAAAFVT